MKLTKSIPDHSHPQLHAALFKAADLGAHVQQCSLPHQPDVLNVYICERTADPVREAQELTAADEPPLTEWLQNYPAILREWFADEMETRDIGTLRINFADEIVLPLQAAGIGVEAWKDYLVPVAFADLT